MNQNETNDAESSAVVLNHSWSQSDESIRENFTSDVRVELEDFGDAISDHNSTSIHSASTTSHSVGCLERNDMIPSEQHEFKDLRVVIHYPDQPMVCCIAIDY